MEPKPEAFRKWANDVDTVKPHCKFHTQSQGGTIQGADAKDDVMAMLNEFGV